MCNHQQTGTPPAAAAARPCGLGERASLHDGRGQGAAGQRGGAARGLPPRRSPAPCTHAATWHTSGSLTHDRRQRFAGRQRLLQRGQQLRCMGLAGGRCAARHPPASRRGPSAPRAHSPPGTPRRARGPEAAQTITASSCGARAEGGGGGGGRGGGGGPMRGAGGRRLARPRRRVGGARADRCIGPTTLKHTRKSPLHPVLQLHENWRRTPRLQQNMQPPRPPGRPARWRPSSLMNAAGIRPVRRHLHLLGAPRCTPPREMCGKPHRHPGRLASDEQACACLCAPHIASASWQARGGMQGQPGHTFSSGGGATAAGAPR